MGISGIYKIQSKAKPQKYYIGSACNIRCRWQRHKLRLKQGTHDNKKLQNHYNKYGADDLQFSVVVGCDRNELLQNEQYFIDILNLWFNICKRAGSTIGIKLSEETRLKISIAGKGVKRSEETKAKMRKPKSEEHRKHISLAQKGKIFTDEHKRNISKGKTGKISTPAMIEANRKRFLGKKHSPETKLKMSNSRKLWHEKHKLAS